MGPKYVYKNINRMKGAIISVNYSPMLNNYINECTAQKSGGGTTASCAQKEQQGDAFVSASKEENAKILQEKSDAINGKHGLISHNLSNRLLQRNAGMIANLPAAKAASFSGDVVELYKNDKITYEEANRMLKTQEIANDSTVNIISSIITGFVATGAGIALKGKTKAAYPVIIAATSAIGGVVNAGVRFVDRAFNKIEGDETDKKTILKDLGGGAVNGFFSGVNAGAGKEFSEMSAARKIGFEGLKQIGIIVASKILGKSKSKEEAGA